MSRAGPGPTAPLLAAIGRRRRSGGARVGRPRPAGRVARARTVRRPGVGPIPAVPLPVVVAVPLVRRRFLPLLVVSAGPPVALFGGVGGAGGVVGQLVWLVRFALGLRRPAADAVYRLVSRHVKVGIDGALGGRQPGRSGRLGGPHGRGGSGGGDRDGGGGGRGGYHAPATRRFLCLGRRQASGGCGGQDRHVRNVRRAHRVPRVTEPRYTLVASLACH